LSRDSHLDCRAAPNPLKGTINRTLSSGKSQDGRFLKTFLLNGFNMVGDRRVFDGMHVFVSAAGLLPILQMGIGPLSSADEAPTFANPDFPGVNDGPLTIGEIIAKVEARGEVAPKMMLVSSTSDYYSLRVSLGRTGESGTVDQPLPANVRMYDIAGGQHVDVPQAPTCTLPPGRLDWAPVSRALLLRLDAWVSHNAEPPANELMPLQPASGEPPALRAPTRLSNAVIQVPKRDQDIRDLSRASSCGAICCCCFRAPQFTLLLSPPEQRQHTALSKQLGHRKDRCRHLKASCGFASFLSRNLKLLVSSLRS
jgi:hypothetical protein